MQALSIDFLLAFLSWWKKQDT